MRHAFEVYFGNNSADSSTQVQSEGQGSDEESEESGVGALRDRGVR
jgi:hypothetical protein